MLEMGTEYLRCAALAHTNVNRVLEIGYRFCARAGANALYGEQTSAMGLRSPYGTGCLDTRPHLPVLRTKPVSRPVMHFRNIV